ncbi:MAG: hypothetical protein HC831_27030 [Chloroflexia bacterium]|nr:hypothetical protein [Chloroflexia bacterium]
MFGQYWIPMFITGCFPGTVSFNTGTPIQPFGRNPQIRITQKLGDIKLIGILSSQRDYANRGPVGATGAYLSNSGIPAVDFQIHYDKSNKDAGTALLIGAGAGYKKIVPSLKSATNYKTDDAVSSMSAIGFFKIQLPAITFKLEGAYSENADNNLSLGGFSVHEETEAATGAVKYTPSKTMSAWTDIQTNGKTQFGLFAGYTQNQGFKDDVILNQDNSLFSSYGLGTNIESLYRVSPRVVFNLDHIRFALEGEYTAAKYGDGTYDAKGIPQNTTEADNLRILFAVYYFFK